MCFCLVFIAPHLVSHYIIYPHSWLCLCYHHPFSLGKSQQRTEVIEYVWLEMRWLAWGVLNYTHRIHKISPPQSDHNLRVVLPYPVLSLQLKQLPNTCPILPFNCFGGLGARKRAWQCSKSGWFKFLLRYVFRIFLLNSASLDLRKKKKEDHVCMHAWNRHSLAAFSNKFIRSLFYASGSTLQGHILQGHRSPHSAPLCALLVR